MQLSLRDHPSKTWSPKNGGLLIEGHLKYNVRPGEMKMLSLNRGQGVSNLSNRSGLSGRFDCNSKFKGKANNQ